VPLSATESSFGGRREDFLRATPARVYSSSVMVTVFGPLASFGTMLPRSPAYSPLPPVIGPSVLPSASSAARIRAPPGILAIPLQVNPAPAKFCEEAGVVAVKTISSPGLNCVGEPCFFLAVGGLSTTAKVEPFSGSVKVSVVVPASAAGDEQGDQTDQGEGRGGSGTPPSARAGPPSRGDAVNGPAGRRKPGFGPRPDHYGSWSGRPIESPPPAFAR
jgi:hypothetical protein